MHMHLIFFETNVIIAILTKASQMYDYTHNYVLVNLHIGLQQLC